MAFSKYIVYGNCLELYTYEKDFYEGLRRSKRNSEADLMFEDNGNVGEFEMGKAKQGRREDNAQRVRMAFRRLVISNLTPRENPLLITFTYEQNQTDLRQGYRDFTSFIQSLRYRYRDQFSYISVPEFQKRGAVHFHALFWGLPPQLFLEERQTRFLAKLWSLGFLYIKQTDGNQKIAGYLSKYMAKAFTDPRLKSQKSYVASRNIKRPIIGSGNFNFGCVLDEFLGVDNYPIVSRDYMTEYLGKCNYQLFNIKT